ncbi:hypothetical protein OF83DRAFT_1070612 [Amylostereum chailletii]|nr:hypothetical protein OF83DRAFT_1070612 [Amylostereum chailletii]
MNTYEQAVRGTQDPTSVDGTADDTSRVPLRGRPRHERIPYCAAHPKAQTHCRVRRAKAHNTLPNFIGRPFARCDDEDNRDFYCAAMLMLLQPWRHINDL